MYATKEQLFIHEETHELENTSKLLDCFRYSDLQISAMYEEYLRNLSPEKFIELAKKHGKYEDFINLMSDYSPLEIGQKREVVEL